MNAYMVVFLCNTVIYVFLMEASRCACNVIYYMMSVSTITFITQGNYKATCFDYRFVIFRPILTKLKKK